MASKQTAASHGAYDVLTHFILAPIFLINFVLAVVLAFHTNGTQDLLIGIWLVILSAAFVLLNIKTRVYSLKIQDRVIRLEERLRLTQLLPAAEAATAIAALSTKQLIGLRFASDAELPALVRATLAENLDQKAIKQRIETWRPDDARI
jgi:hypothetical protein